MKSALMDGGGLVSSSRPKNYRFVKLRPYQEEAVEHVATAICKNSRNRSGLVSLPTGAGKTVIAAEVLRRQRDGRALVIAHTSVLVEQLRQQISYHLKEKVGLVLDGLIERADARVVVGSRQSLTAARIAKLTKQGSFSLLILDEAHHAVNDSTYAAIQKALRRENPRLFTLGLTATPWNNGGSLILNHWLYSREISDLIPMGVLSPVKYVSVGLPLSMSDVKMSSSNGDRDYSQKTLEPAVLEVVEQTVKKVSPLIGSRTHIVVFAVTVKHAMALTESFRQHGLKAVCVWGAMDKKARDEALASWRAGKTWILVNVGIVSEGFDEPKISTIVFARPTASTLFYLQALGRGLRVAPKKSDCLVIDCVGLGDLRDARQCTLDELVPEVASLSANAGSPYQIIRRNQGKRLMRDPNADDHHVWISLSPGSLYALNRGRDKKRKSNEGDELNNARPCSRWIFVKRDSSSGLYDAHFVPEEKKYGPAPFPALFTDLRAALRDDSSVLFAKNAKWRKEEATLPQIDFLKLLDPFAAQHALIEHWTRGRVSDAIATHQARRLAYDLGLLQKGAA